MDYHEIHSPGISPLPQTHTRTWTVARTRPRAGSRASSHSSTCTNSLHTTEAPASSSFHEVTGLALNTRWLVLNAIYILAYCSPASVHHVDSSAQDSDRNYSGERPQKNTRVPSCRRRRVHFRVRCTSRRLWLPCELGSPYDWKRALMTIMWACTTIKRSVASVMSGGDGAATMSVPQCRSHGSSLSQRM